MHADNPGPTVYIQIESENLERDGVIVILEWTQENNSYYSYNVSVIPYPVSTLNPEGMRAQLNVSYNVRYNVSVVATPIINCGQGNDNTVTASIELHYGEYIRNQLIELSSCI